MALNPGEIGFVQYNADGTDDFGFVALVDIAGGEQILFTDNGWFGDDSGFRPGEGVITWTAPASGVAAGTVVVIDTTPGASIGTVSETGDLNFAASGDQIVAYRVAGTSIVPIAALNNEGDGVFQADATSSNTSALPAGLVLGESAVAVPEIDNVAYQGPLTGTKAALQAALFDAANWTGGSDTVNQSFAGAFTLIDGATPGVIVGESGGSTGVAEGGATDDVTIGLATVPAAPVTVTVIPDAQVDLGAGAGHSIELAFTPDDALIPQVVTVAAVDDDLVEGDHTATLSIAVASADPGYDGLAVDAVTVAIADNDQPPTPIHLIQGSGAVSPLVGAEVTIEAIVVGDFQNGDADGTRNLGGFFVQEEDADADADPSTSEGIFVFDGSFGVDVALGDLVRITGTVAEFFGETQIGNVTGVTVLSSANPLPTAAVIELPAAAVTTNQNGAFQPDLEAFEGMRVTLPQTLTISEQFQLDRFNEIKLVEGDRPQQFTQTNAPNVAGYDQHLREIGARTITYDDGLNVQNAAIDNLDGFAPYGTATAPRMGDTVTGLSGVLDYKWAGNAASGATWRVRAVEDGETSFESANPRPAAPADVGGSLKVASFNVLNFFTTLDTFPGNEGVGPNQDQEPRGADTNPQSARPGTGPLDEFTRQVTKLATAIEAIDADILALIELENDFLDPGLSPGDRAAQGDRGTAIEFLVGAVNARLGASVYDWVDPGREFVGGDAISVGFLYNATTVVPVGAPAILDDPAFTDPNDTGLARNRPALAQTFEEIDSGETFIAVVNHLKSKGASGLAAGDPSNPDSDQGDGQGFWNDTRTKAAAALADWLATDPTGSGDPDVLILGDLNAYGREDPIAALEAAGYVDLAKPFIGDDAYSFVFDGQTGTLDYALASPTLAAHVTGAAEWHINADEADALDYNLEFGRDPAIFDASSPARNSDHDPLIVGLQLRTEPVEPLVAAASLRFDGSGLLPKLTYVEDGVTRAEVLQVPFGEVRDPGDEIPFAVFALDSDDAFCLFGNKIPFAFVDRTSVLRKDGIAIRDGDDGLFGLDPRRIDGDEVLVVAIEEDAPFAFARAATVFLGKLGGGAPSVSATAYLDGDAVGRFTSAGTTLAIAPDDGRGFDRIELAAEGDTRFTFLGADLFDLFAADVLIA
ncbi:MAG: ExeM/NucH family extracellular endonuclease [Rhodospirillales bacterium]